MQALQFFKSVTADKSNFLERLLNLLNDNSIRYCVIGTVAASAFVEPLVSLDFDLVITSYQLGRFEALLASTFIVKRGPRVIEIRAPDSRLRANVYTESRYAGFVERAEMRNVLELTLPIAQLDDILQARVWAWQDAGRKQTKRNFDLAEIALLLDRYPRLKSTVPPAILTKLEMLGA